MRSRAFTILLALAAACSDESAARPDAAAAADAGAGDVVSADASAQDARGADSGGDAGPGRDVSAGRDVVLPDGSLTGTSLEGVALEWNAELWLCEHWLEGGTLDEARARRVQVYLPPQARGSMEPAELASASIESGNAARSPFSADQFSLRGAVTSLIEWRSGGPTDQTTLTAELAHDYPGGTLYETLQVQRRAPDRSPVVYTGRAFSELSFSFEAPGGERYPLERCGGPEDMETAVVVLAASRPGAPGEWMTLMREQRTRRVVAGSAPVYPTRAQAAFPFQGRSAPLLAAGQWSQLYTAEHHNWNEHSVVSFDGDLRWYYLYFWPLARGEMPMLSPMIRSIELAGVNTPGQRATAAITRITTPDYAETTETYDVDVDWTRVDETELLRELAVDGCASGEVRSLWRIETSGEFLFQAGVCTNGGPLTDLALLVPINFPYAPQLAGTRFDRTQISPATVDGYAGVEVELGSHHLQLAEQPAGTVVMKVFDAQGALLEDTFTSAIELFETWYSSPSDRIDAQNREAGVFVSLDRLWIDFGGGRSTIYAPIFLELRFAGETHRVDAWDRLDYTNTHHNWDDSLIADDGELRMEWNVIDRGGAYQVRAERIADGVEVLPLTELRP